MADVDITSLSVEISAESQGAELNIDKLTTAISNLRTKGSVGKVCTSLDKLSSSISALKQASAGISGLDKVTNFLNGISSVNTTAGVKGVNSAVNAIKKIPSAVSALNGVDFYSMSGSITQLTNALAPLSILDISGLKSLGSAFKAIGTVPDLTDKLKSADLDSFASSCQKISTALTPLASQLETVGNAFAKLPPQLSKVVTQANRVTAANERQKKSYMSLSNQLNGFMRSAAKLVSLKAIATYLGNAAEKFNSYYEAANLFGVSMKGLTGEASTFINKMETLLGIDPTEAMNNMATIQGLTTSFGMASDKAYVLSKNLTQLGYDLASLKNIPVADAFTKIQAAISGELEPIRRLGVDLSQARLQQELLNLGYSQSVSTLSQADKAVLRYIAIMKQTTDAQGDFARTISSPANQIKILKAQLNSLARSVGSLLYPALKSILPPLIAAVELIKELVTGIATLMGVKVEFPDFSSASDAVGGVTDAMDNTIKATGKAAKAFKNYIMGFDELNVIQKDDGSSDSSGSGAGAAGNLLGDVDLSGYDMFKQYNEEFAKQIDSVKQKIKDMLPVIGAVTAALALWKLTAFIADIVDAIKKIGILKGMVAGGILIGIGFYLMFDGIKKAIEDKLNAINFTEIIVGAITFVGGAALLGAKIAEFITTSFADSAVAKAITAAGGKMGGALVAAVVAGVIAGVAMFVTGVYDALTNGLNILNGLLIPAGSTMAGAAVGAIIGSLGGPIGTGIGALIGLIVGAMTDVGIAIYQNWDKITSQLDKVSAEFKQWFVGVGEWWNEKWENFKTNFQTAWESLPGFVQHPIQALGQASAGLKQWFVGVGEWWNQKWAGFKENWDKAWNSLVDTIKNLPAKFLDYGKNIVQGLIDGINKGIENAKKSVGGLAKAIIDKFTTDTEIHSPSALFERFGEFIDQGFANGITAALPYVEQAMTNLANVVQQKGNEMIDYGTTTATNFVNGFFNGLDSKWQELDSGLQSDFFGTAQTFIQAAQSGDWKTVGTTIAASIWGAMGDEQRKRVKSVASDLLGRLSKELKSQASSLLNTAATIGENLVSALTQNFGKVSSETQTMLSSITQAFGNVKSPLATAANAISAALSGGLLSSFPTIFAGFAGLVSTIGTAVAGMLSAVGAALSATIFGTPAGIVALAAAAALGVAIAGIVSKLGGSHSTSSYSDTSQYVGSSSYNSSTSSSSYSGTYSAASGNSEEMRDAVYNGCYNAFLDIWQRYGEEISDGRDVRVYLDGKQLTASVEKTQKERGVSIMGTEVYSY